MKMLFIDFFRRGSVPGLAGLVLALAAGCSGPRQEFAEVEGKVTLNGRPLAGAIVRFYPITEQKEQPPYASGITDAAGYYTLTHEGDEPGALVGRNCVVVYWPSRDLRESRGDGPPLPTPSRPIPIRYTVANDTPLTFEVKAGDRQTMDLKLED